MSNPGQAESENAPNTQARMGNTRKGDASHMLAVIKSYDILEGLPLDCFDHITAMAADIFAAPIAAVRVAESDRIWCQSPAMLSHGPSSNFSGFMRSSVDSWGLSGKKPNRSLTMPLVAIEFGLKFYVSAPLMTREGYTVGTLCVIDREPRRIEERQARQLKFLAAIVMDQMDIRLAALSAVEQADILSREVDHRVMNSLQFVSGLLAMQSRSAPTPEAVDQLTRAANRVAAVARVHRHFTLNEDVQRVPVVAYLQRLCGELADILDVPIEVTGTDDSVPSSQILAIGFSVNEFVSNAKKYGAPPIKVVFAPNEAGHNRLSVIDEGGGLPSDFTPGEHKRGDGLGMRVVTALASQLSGSLSAGTNATGRGAYFAVTFPTA